MDTQKIKDQAKEIYQKIVPGSKQEKYQGQSVGQPSRQSCCPNISSMVQEAYKQVQGYMHDADLGEGCGIPTQFANLKEGQTVLVLGCGAGCDCFVARQSIGKSGRVIGIESNEEKLNKGREIAQKNSYNNVEFKTGQLENIPMEDNSVDVVLSNAAINLARDKHKVFQEINRVLKSKGTLCFSDFLVEGSLPEKIRQNEEMWQSSLGGAMEVKECLDMVQNAGFCNVQICNKVNADIPDEVFLKHMEQSELEKYKQSGTKMVSATICADKC